LLAQSPSFAPSPAGDPGTFEDHDLVERARNGDRDAFGALVAKHRAKAYGWAKHMTRDEFLAEDIVQEALLNAFLHMSSLVNPARFLPWFHRIVRNQANMKLRRGGLYGKERPITSFSTQDSNDAGMDWSNIDHILFRLERSAGTLSRSNPMERLIRQENLEGIKALLHCLTHKERQIFEAHFFEQLSPAEIANLFQNKVSNVYNLISRSRAKVQKERLRVQIDQYIRDRRERGLPHKKVLDASKLVF
jgi:RNA polymerase sigma factor (sigma-70 family)